MNIYEAIKARTQREQYITRKTWMYPTSEPCTVPIKILPTNSPDLCVVESITKGKAGRLWTPSGEDLLANDWVVVG